jgi:hypothetical protein
MPSAPPTPQASTVPSAPPTPQASTSAIAAKTSDNLSPPSSSAGDDDGPNSIQQPTSVSPPDSPSSTLARVLAQPQPYTRSKAVNDAKNGKKPAIWVPQQNEDDSPPTDGPSDGNDAEQDPVSDGATAGKVRLQGKKARSKQRKFGSSDPQGEGSLVGRTERKQIPLRKGSVFHKLLGQVSR